MGKLSVPLVFAISLMATGCSTLPQRYQLTAEPLESVADAKKNASNDNLAAVHDLVQNSQTSCASFVNSMFARTAGTNTILGVTGTILSAIATAVSPIPTVHLFSAGSTIATGTKTTIDTEYLNSLTISHITQAIQTTYGTDMQKYITYLNSKTDSNSVNVYAERSTILSYHNECSLASADGSISSSLQPGQGTTSSTPIAVSYVAKPGEEVSDVAIGLMNSINSDAGFNSAGIKVTRQSGPVLTLSVPAGTKLSITPAPASGHAGATVAGTTTSTVTISGTPQAGDTIKLSVSLPVQSGTVAPTLTPSPQPQPLINLAKPAPAVSGTAPAKK